HRDAVPDVLGDRDGLERGAVPAGAGDRSPLGAQAGTGHHVVVGGPHRAGHPAQQALALLDLQLAQQRAVDGDDPRGAVGDQRAALRVDDQTAGRLDDQLAHGLLGGRGLVGLAGEDLEIPQPPEQGEEQAQHERLHHDEPHPAAPGGVRGRWCAARQGLAADAHQATRVASSRRSTASASGSTTGVTSTSYPTDTGTTFSTAATVTPPSPRTSPVSANTEVPTNEQAATVTTAATADEPASLRTRPAR